MEHKNLHETQEPFYFVVSGEKPPPPQGDPPGPPPENGQPPGPPPEMGPMNGPPPGQSPDGMAQPPPIPPLPLGV